MSTDKELLELAAKAAGYVKYDFFSNCVWEREDGAYTVWNPLHHVTSYDPEGRNDPDGDALRLAIKLNISIEFGYCSDDAPMVSCGKIEDKETWGMYACFPNPQKETRRCIVRAAAEIGKYM